MSAGVRVPRRRSSVSNLSAATPEDSTTTTPNASTSTLPSTASVELDRISNGGVMDGEDMGKEAAARWRAIRTKWLTPPSAGTELPFAMANGVVDTGKGTRKLTAEERQVQDEAIVGLVEDFDRSCETGQTAGFLGARRTALLKLGKQLTDGKRLNRPLQLQHATSILYRTWMCDGTVPVDYRVAAAALRRPMVGGTGVPRATWADDVDRLTDPDEAEFRVPAGHAGSSTGIGSINSRRIPAFEELADTEDVESEDARQDETTDAPVEHAGDEVAGDDDTEG